MLRRITLSLLLLSGISAAAQTTDDAIRARLLDKPLYLRGMWKSSTLRFDSTGQLQSQSDKESWTVCGIDIDKVSKSGKRLEIEGERVAVKFVGDVPSRLQVPSGGAMSKPEKIKIEIAAPSSTDYSPALDAVFADGLADLAPDLPFLWQQYARRHFVANGTSLVFKNPPPAVAGPAIRPVSGPETVQPRALKVSDPEFSEYARKVKTSGNSLIALVVNEAGVPTQIRVVRPIGLGLDEKAEEAVRQYQFAPAMRNGQPVASPINIEVNFQIF